MAGEPDSEPTGMSFRLDAEFVGKWSRRSAPFGFNGLGELVYRRTYARFKDAERQTKEEWYETVERVVNGTFSMQKNWYEKSKLHWNQERAQQEAQDMYEKIFNMKFLPPGRGLWAMGSALTVDRSIYAALNNCAFVSTAELGGNQEPWGPFCFLMDASMLGVGVGFDTKGAGLFMIQAPKAHEGLHVVDDSREGWVESVKTLLKAYFRGEALPSFDLSQLRPAGSPIAGFGGVSQGPVPLAALHKGIIETLEPLVGRPITVTAIVDIMNKIGRCVVAGNVRRTAEIAFGDPDSEEYVDLKNYEKNPQRAEFGWTSNNSVFCSLGMNYEEVCKRVVSNGEPGFAWLDNMRNFGRMNGHKDTRDAKAMGGNPCLEQTLENHEMCCLVETFPFKHETLADYKDTLRSAFLYAKTVTLGATNWPETNAVLLRNRRIGCSMSGLAQFVAARQVGGLHELGEWCEEGYEEVQQADSDFSERFGIPTSIKSTSIKPSGTVSLLAGATPGMHYPESRFYIRRVRLAANSDMIKPLEEAGYRVEEAVGDASTVVVEIPVDVGEGVRTVKDISLWEQLHFAAFLQEKWADNQVSCTVTFDPEAEGPSLKHALDYFQYKLKGVSFLPRIDYGAFPQMPYEEIDEETFRERTMELRVVNLRGVAGAPDAEEEEEPDKFCDADSCRR
ncbi:unnamed protein product [Chrysoparadoxa australica]